MCDLLYDPMGHGFQSNLLAGSMQDPGMYIIWVCLIVLPDDGIGEGIMTETLTAADYVTLKKFIATHLTRYRMKYDEELLEDIRSEIVMNLINRGYLIKFQNSKSTLLYLEARSGVANYKDRVKAKKRVEDESYPLKYHQPYNSDDYLPIELRIDLRAFKTLLTDDELMYINDYREGYEFSEILDRTGMKSTSLARKLKDLRLYAAQYFEMDNKEELYENWVNTKKS